jgi:hypothetical protein
MIGGLFFRNAPLEIEANQDLKSPRMLHQNSGYSIGLQADEGTPDRKPTVMETNNSGNLIKKTRGSQILNMDQLNFSEKSLNLAKE